MVQCYSCSEEKFWKRVLKSHAKTVLQFLHIRIRAVAVMYIRKENVQTKIIAVELSLNPLAMELDIYSLAHHLCKM